LAKKKSPPKKKVKKQKTKKVEAPVSQHTPEVSNRLVEIEAKLPLTDRAKVERGEIAAKKLQERDRLVLERKSVASEYKARIDALTSEATKLLLEFTEGRELRTVKAREIRNFVRNLVEYHYKGEMIHSRPMTLADRQDELPLKEKDLPKVSAVVPKDESQEKAPESEKPAAVIRHEDLHPAVGASVHPISQPLPKHDPVAEAHAADENARRADIAGTIQEQTNPRSAWTQTDGART
jgi:hypothetical protein